MNFTKAYEALKHGAKIKCPEWKGYWVWENNTIMIHTKEGNVLDIRDTKNTDYTFGFIIRDDWEILEGDVKEENCLTFEEALLYAKSGKHVSRKFWNNPEHYVEAELDLKGNPHLVSMSKFYGSKINWIPFQEDIFADDWFIVN